MIIGTITAIVMVFVAPKPYDECHAFDMKLIIIATWTMFTVSSLVDYYFLPR